MGRNKSTPHIPMPASRSEESAAREKHKPTRGKTNERRVSFDTSREKLAKETAYRPLFAKITKVMCMNGVPLEEIADAFQVDKLTIDRWKREHKDFDEAFELVVDLANGRVRRSLHQVACGYEYVDVKIFRHKRRIIYAPFIVHVPADVQAASFWLANRLPNEWALKPDASKKPKRGGS